MAKKKVDPAKVKKPADKKSKGLEVGHHEHLNKRSQKYESVK